MKQQIWEARWGIAALIIAVGLSIVFLLRQPSTPEPIECYTEEVKNMSLQEVADLFDDPVAELEWIPDGVDTVPQITTYAGWYNCSIYIKYPDADPQSQAKSITLIIDRVTGIQPTKIAPECVQRFSVSKTIDTNCRIDLDSTNATLWLRLQMGADFSREESIRILESISVIEPNELKPNAQTN